MRKPFRITAGIFIIALVGAAAYLATIDCRITLYIYDNCMYMRLQDYLLLPDNRFLRLIVSECVGVFLAWVLWVTYRYLLRPRDSSRNSSETPPVIPEPPGD